MDNTISVSHHYYPDPTSIPYRTHAHDVWEFMFIVKGNPFCMVDGNKYLIKDHSLLAFKPAQIHRVQASGKQPYEYFSIMCPKEALSPALDEFFTNSVGLFTFNNPKTLYYSFLDFEGNGTNSKESLASKSNSTKVNNLLQTALDDSVKRSYMIPLSEDMIVKKAVSYIESNVYGISRVNQISKAIGISRESLYAHFISNMLISPMRYVWAKKAVLAKKGQPPKRKP